jgi:hypothetical protein
MMAACGFGYVAGTLMTGPACWESLGVSVAWVKGDWESVFVYAEYPVTGLILGLLAGTLWKGWKAGMLLGTASGLIFTAGFWLNYGSWNLLFGPGMKTLVQAKIVNTEAWNFVCWLIGYTLFGGIVGIFWGILLERSRRIRSIVMGAV